MVALEELCAEWFKHPQWWFVKDPDIDSYIVNKYEHLLQCHDTSVITIAHVLLYDQIPRHIYRHQDANHIVEYFLQIALLCSRYLIDSKMSFSDEEFCFVMMPFRHTNDPSNITFVIKETFKRMGDCNDNNTLKRYLKATLNKFPQLVSFVDRHDYDPNLAWNMARFSEVAEYAPDEINKYALDYDLKSDICYQHMLKVPTPRQIIVSLSGGVDSMVCCYILKAMGCDIRAVHINYCNRPVEEEYFVRSWCQTFGIPLYVRRIDELQREPCMRCNVRQLYEVYTRNVRFNTYKQVWRMVDGGTEPYVVLGHNNDDRFENILTNICNKEKHDNLFGMSFQCMLDDIVFLRPLLEVDKQHIYNFARKVGIPYLHDSTPKWSQRGKIRDVVRPVLENWNHRCVDGFYALTEHMSELTTLINDNIQNLVDRTHKKDRVYTLHININQHIIGSRLFWKSYLIRLLGVCVRQKSLDNFMEKIIIFKKHLKPTRVVLNKDLVAELYPERVILYQL